MTNNYTLYILSDNAKEYHLLDIDDIQMSVLFNIENYQDITTRKDTITKDLELKATDRNNIALGHLFDLSRYSSEDYTTQLAHNFIANKYVKCILLNNNIQILAGTFVIKDITTTNGFDVYNAAITGSFFSFFNNLKERYLHELDSIDDEIVYNIQTITGSWYYYNDNFVFPTIDYGEDDRPIVKQNLGQDNEFDVVPDYYDSTYDFKNYRPSIYLSRYIQAIFRGFRFNESSKKFTQFAENGSKLSNYSYVSDFFSQNHFKKLFVAHNEKHLTKNITGQWAQINTSTMSYGGTDSLAPTLIGSIFDANANSEFFDFYRSGNWEFWRDGNRSFSANNVPILRFKDTYLNSSLSLTMTVRLPSDFAGEYVIGLCDISQSRQINSSNMRFAQKVTKVAGNAQTFNININQDVTNISGEWVIALYRENDQSSNHTDGDGTGVVFSSATIKLGRTSATSQVPYSLNDKIKLSDVLPRDIKLQDFFKSIMSLFNLYMISSPENENTFIIEPYSTFYKDVINLDRYKAVNWTSKIDFNNKKLLTNLNLPKSYKYKFTEDSDMLNEYYKTNHPDNALGELSINDSKGTGEAKESEIIFAPTLSYNSSSNPKKLACLHKGGFLQGKKEPQKTKLRLMYFNDVQNVASFDTYYRSQIVHKSSTYAPASMFYFDVNGKATDTLLFDTPVEFFTSTNNIQDIYDDQNITTYSKYHKQQVKDLLDENIVILEANAYLDENDIATLDFRKPIFVQSNVGNSYFKLVEVDYVNSESPSSIKLQKIVK